MIPLQDDTPSARKAYVRAHIGGFLAGMLLVPLLKRRDTPLFAP
jgi:hypothetical protein